MPQELLEYATEECMLSFLISVANDVLLCFSVLGESCKNAEFAFLCMLNFHTPKTPWKWQSEHLKELLGELCVRIDSCSLFKAHNLIKGLNCACMNSQVATLVASKAN